MVESENQRDTLIEESLRLWVLCGDGVVMLT
jgi:hypothetical protein